MKFKKTMDELGNNGHDRFLRYDGGKYMVAISIDGVTGFYKVNIFKGENATGLYPNIYTKAGEKYKPVDLYIQPTYSGNMTIEKTIEASNILREVYETMKSIQLKFIEPLHSNTFNFDVDCL